MTNKLYECLESWRTDIKFDIKDMSEAVWTTTKTTPGTAGVFLKYRENDNYFKLSSFDTINGFYGYESVLELVVKRLGEWLDINVLDSTLEHVRVYIEGKVYDTYTILSCEYRRSGERRLTLEQYLQLTKLDVTNYPFWEDLTKMFFLDYIVYNRDRHCANIEILSQNNIFRLAPFFDNGSCLTAPLFGNLYDVKDDYWLRDNPVNNYIGSKSLLNNLKDYCLGVYLPVNYIPYNIMININKILPQKHCDSIFNMLNARFKNALEILNTPARQ